MANCGFIFIIMFLIELCSPIHLSMSEIELLHIFGTTKKDEVPEYWLDIPTKSSFENSFLYEINIDGIKEVFLLTKKKNLFWKGLNIVTRNGMNSTVVIDPETGECVYQGRSLSHNGSVIALTGCEEKMHGIVISHVGNYFLIQPHSKSTNHIIHKRNIDRQENYNCIFDSSDDPYPQDMFEIKLRSSLLRNIHHPLRTVAKNNEQLTIELAVFADDAMWNHFFELYGYKADSEMHTFILAVVNNIDILYTQHSIQPKVNIHVVRYEVMKTPPRKTLLWLILVMQWKSHNRTVCVYMVELQRALSIKNIVLSARNHNNGDVDRLLDVFCQYQHALNPPDDQDPRHWDHALLFSGYDLYRDKLQTVAGYAPVKGMCSGIRSCTINEGLDFGSVFVITHEMGHNLGMYHDGDNECDMRCCIMSPSVGTGKTHWSRCSVNEMKTFIGDVCSMIWCGNGEGVIRSSHPALEGSYCGSSKICQSGYCVPSTSKIVPIHGGWSVWKELSRKSSGNDCGKCSIQGQIPMRRSIRQCNKPSPNNGGFQCKGGSVRGIRCNVEMCAGLSIDEYATKICNHLKENGNDSNTMYSGKGIQFIQSPCKVWCVLSKSNNIRTVSNFPDGTPCGEQKYCIKGACMPLLCNGSTVAASILDCAFTENRIREQQLDLPLKQIKFVSYRNIKNSTF